MILADNGSPWYISGAPEPALEQRRAAPARPADRARLRGRGHELAAPPRALTGARNPPRFPGPGGEIARRCALSTPHPAHRAATRCCCGSSPSTGWRCRDHVAALLGASASAAKARLSRLRRRDARERARVLQPAADAPDRAPAASRRSEAPAARRGSSARLRARRRRRVAVARGAGGTFGPCARSSPSDACARTTERADRTTEPLGVKLGGIGPAAVQALHYPDLLLETAEADRVAIELELSSKGRARRERILAGYAADAGSTASSTWSRARRWRAGPGVGRAARALVAGPRPARSLRSRRSDRPAVARRRATRTAPGRLGPWRGAGRDERPRRWAARTGCRRLRRAAARCPPAWARGLAAVARGRDGDPLARRGRAAATRRADSSAGRDGAFALGRRARAVAPLMLSDRQLSAHGLILGASGAGKSTTLLTILTEQIRRGRPVVAIDMKGSPAFARELRGAAAAAGRPFAVWTLDGPAHWNPLAARQRHRAEGQADRHRALHRAPLPARRRALRPDGAAGAAATRTRPSRRRSTRSSTLMDPRRLPARCARLPRERAERVRTISPA